MGYADNFICPAHTTIIGRKGSINNPIYVEEPFWNVDTAFGLCAKSEALNSKYLFYFCKQYNFERHNKATTLSSLTKADLARLTNVGGEMIASLDAEEDLQRKLLRKIEMN